MKHDTTPHTLSVPDATRNVVLNALEDLVSRVPASAEPSSSRPRERALEVIESASRKAGLLSATLAIPPGPLGLLTVIPDLVKVWDIQRQMVADIAACYGKSAQLNRQMMVYCLFRHGAAMLARDIMVRVGERLVMKRGSLKLIQKMLQYVSIRLTQKSIGKSVSRWVPVLGPLIVGGYSMMDTRNVGKTALETFSRVIEFEMEDAIDTEDIEPPDKVAWRGDPE